MPTEDINPNLPARPAVERVFISADSAAVVQGGGEKVLGVFKTGAGAITKTISRMLMLGFVLAIASGYIAGRTSGTAGGLAVLTAIFVSIVAALSLAWQRAGLLTIAHAIEASKLGSTTFKKAFAAMLDDNAATPGLFARTAGRIPLSQAELRLHEAMSGLSFDFQAGGLLRGIIDKAKQILFATIRNLTIAAFRREDRDNGGIDLATVRDALGDKIDHAAAASIRRRVALLTVVYVVATVAITLAAALGLQQLFAA